MGVLQSFSIKNIFYDKMDLRIFIFMLRYLRSLAWSKSVYVCKRVKIMQVSIGATSLTHCEIR